MPYTKICDLPESLRSTLTELGYACKDVEVVARELVSRNYAGSAGQKGFCAIVDLATGRHTIELGSWGGANMFSPDNAVDLDGKSYAIPPNVAVITGSSGGRGTFATVYVRPDAIAPLLPPAAEVTARQRWILYCFDAYTSAGRKDEFRRVSYTGRGPSDVELDALVSRGFLKRNRAGATQITTEGKNAVDRHACASVPYAD